MGAMHQLLRAAYSFVQLDLSQRPLLQYHRLMRTAVGNLADAAEFERALAAFVELQDSFSETTTSQGDGSSSSSGRLVELQALAESQAVAKGVVNKATASSDTELKPLITRRDEADDVVRVALDEIKTSDTIEEQRRMEKVKQDLEKQRNSIQALAAFLGFELTEKEDKSDTSALSLLQMWQDNQLEDFNQ